MNVSTSNDEKWLKKLKKDIGYKGCKNCKNQIEPLRTCEWMDHGGDGVLHLICRNGKGEKMNKDPDTIQFVLNGCDISFYAEAPADMTVKQLIEQADRIVPDWCACGVRSLKPCDWILDTEIVFTYDDVKKTRDEVSCTIKPKEKNK